MSFITVNCADVCAGVRSTLGFSVTASASCEGAKSSLLWPPRSVLQSCRLNGNRTQHLHRLQVASVASGWSQSVSLASSMPMSVDPINCPANNVWSPVQTHIFLHAVLGKAKHLLHLSAVKHGACESDTEPRLQLRLAEPLATATSILLLLLFCSNEPNAIPVCRVTLARYCIKISRWSPRQATSCASSSNMLTVCLLGIVFGESSVFQHRVRKKRRGMR